jgi:hypothetical protein
VVLIDSVSGTPQELASPREIEHVSQAEPAAAAADLPLLLQAACDQIGATKSAAGTIWICSDQRANDWKVADPAWPAIRETLAKMPQSVRLTLLAYAEPAADNLAVRVTQAVLEPRGKTWELLSISRFGGRLTPAPTPTPRPAPAACLCKSNSGRRDRLSRSN